VFCAAVNVVTIKGNIDAYATCIGIKLTIYSRCV